MSINGRDHQDLVIYAFRYALGRSSYAAHDMIRMVTEQWPWLDRNTRHVIQHDIRNEFQHRWKISSPDTQRRELPYKEGWCAILELELDEGEENCEICGQDYPAT